MAWTKWTSNCGARPSLPSTVAVRASIRTRKLFATKDWLKKKFLQRSGLLRSFTPSLPYCRRSLLWEIYPRFLRKLHENCFASGVNTGFRRFTALKNLRAESFWTAHISRQLENSHLTDHLNRFLNVHSAARFSNFKFPSRIFFVLVCVAATQKRSARNPVHGFRGNSGDYR